jgi:hypothetical protein
MLKSKSAAASDYEEKVAALEEKEIRGDWPNIRAKW